jgi:hypothetical protein
MCIETAMGEVIFGKHILKSSAAIQMLLLFFFLISLKELFSSGE